MSTESTSSWMSRPSWACRCASATARALRRSCSRARCSLRRSRVSRLRMPTKIATNMMFVRWMGVSAATACGSPPRKTSAESAGRHPDTTVSPTATIGRTQSTG